MKETGIKLIKYGQNMDKMSIVSIDMLGSGKRLDNPSLNTVLNIKTSSDYLQTKFRLSE